MIKEGGTWPLDEWVEDAEEFEVISGTVLKVRIWTDKAHGCYADFFPSTGRLTDQDGGSIRESAEATRLFMADVIHGADMGEDEIRKIFRM